MTIKTGAYDGADGQPVIVIVVTGEHDVSRMMHLMHRGVPSACLSLAAAKLRLQIKRHNGGQRALHLLARHGGPDLLTEDRDAPWHTIRRYIGSSPFQDGEVRLWDVEHPEDCRALPRWTHCWFAQDPMRQWWPDALGTWRIRPAQVVNGGDEDGPNIEDTMDIQVFDDGRQDWADWTGYCDLPHADTGAEDRCDRRHAGRDGAGA